MLSQTPKTKPQLEIIPETQFVVFHGDEHNAEAVKLRGIVRLDAPESMSIKGVKVRLEGKRRVGWFYSGGVSAGEVTDKKTFHHELKSLGTSGTHKIKAGTIEWPFEFTLTPDMPESVEGFPNTWVVYNLHADVERPMWNQKDIRASTHVRIVRTLGADQMETTRSRTNADIWANKISYSISIPSDAVVFGTSILADVDLAPLKKGITLGKVELRLTENIVKRIAPSDNSDYRHERVKQDEVEVAKHEMPFPEDSRLTFEDETADNPMMEDERYHFKARLPLPKSLKNCRQDVDTHPINIAHKFKLMVNIHNPEGHTSQLVCRLPVKLFISPNLPIGETNEVQAGVTNLTEEELNSQESTITAPPEYGQHQLDELFSDIAPSGYHTAAPSGFATPAGVLSRRTSNEALNGITTPDTQSDQQISSAALRSRLASLQEDNIPGLSHTNHSPIHSPHGTNSPRPNYAHHSSTTWPRSSPSSSSPRTNSMPQSRRTSDEHDPVAPPTPYDINELTRIPSYGTALRSSNPVTPYTEYPPSYTEATSRPPSPGGLPSPLSAGGGGGGVHARTPRSELPLRSATAGSSGLSSASTGFSSPRSDGSETTVGQPLTRVNTNTRVEEGDARLRMLRGRG